MIEKYTALYSTLDIEYSQAMSGPYEDLSYYGDDAVVIAGAKDDKITGFWRPMVAFGDDKTLKLQIERLYDICPNIYYQDFLIDGKLSVISQFLLRQGYKATPYYTQIIDLTKTVEELHKNLRKSYKSLVNKTNGLQTVLDMKKFREIHEKEKGKTRSDVTWEIQEKMNPLCCVQGLTGSIFYRNGDGAYYASAAGDNNHATIWWSIGLLQRNGYKFVEMGEQVFNGARKLVNISKFKRGFGGKTMTRLNFEKE